VWKKGLRMQMSNVMEGWIIVTASQREENTKGGDKTGPAAGEDKKEGEGKADWPRR